MFVDVLRQWATSSHPSTWQQDAELLDATASEPLTLQEEYAMQQTWLHDEQSACTTVVPPLTGVLCTPPRFTPNALYTECTFILLDPTVPDTPGTGVHGGGMQASMWW